MLRESDLGTRYLLTSRSSGLFRRLDQVVAPEAKIFASGLIGPANGRRLGDLFFAVYHLFPRQIDASLGQPPRFTAGGWLEGVDCQSDEELRARGYGIRLGFELVPAEDQQMKFTWLVPTALRDTPR